jgi:predicted transcriptional regulator of viral defense system
MDSRAQAFVEDLLARGRRTFTREDAEAALHSSHTAAYQSLRRLQKRGWLAAPRRGFYLIVDPEHRRMGAVPAPTWIDDLMQFHGVPYYVGLLSAAALHGAAHQQPQEFQVIAGSVLRPVTVGRVRIRFFFRERMELAATVRMKTASGYIPVSTPEMTAYDLVRYRRAGVSLDHVATVLAELSDQIDPSRLLEIASKGDELPVVQRLGYLLDQAGQQRLTGPLAEMVVQRMPRYVLLEPLSTEEVTGQDPRWRVRVNSTIEVET